MKARLPSVIFSASDEENTLDLKLQHSSLTSAQAVRQLPDIRAAIRILRLYEEVCDALAEFELRSLANAIRAEERFAKEETSHK